MKQTPISFSHKGKTHTVNVILPENGREALLLLDERALVKAASDTLIRDAKHAFLGRKKRKKRLILDVTDPRIQHLLPEILRATTPLIDRSESPSQKAMSVDQQDKTSPAPVSESVEESTPEEGQPSLPQSSVQELQSAHSDTQSDLESLVG